MVNCDFLTHNCRTQLPSFQDCLKRSKVHFKGYLSFVCPEYAGMIISNHQRLLSSLTKLDQCPSHVKPDKVCKHLRDKFCITYPNHVQRITYSSIKTIIGNLDELSKSEEAASEADIVLRVVHDVPHGVNIEESTGRKDGRLWDDIADVGELSFMEEERTHAIESHWSEPVSARLSPPTGAADAYHLVCHFDDHESALVGVPNFVGR